jgi:hypothetical protein
MPLGVLDGWKPAGKNLPVVAANCLAEVPGAEYGLIQSRIASGTFHHCCRDVPTAGNSAPAIIWHLFSQPDAHYYDLGPEDHETKSQPATPPMRPHPPTEHLTGHKVNLQPPRRDERTGWPVVCQPTPRFPLCGSALPARRNL